MSFVLDASVTLAWYFKDEQTTSTNNLLDQLESSRCLFRIGHALGVTSCNKRHSII